MRKHKDIQRFRVYIGLKMNALSYNFEIHLYKLRSEDAGRDVDFVNVFDFNSYIHSKVCHFTSKVYNYNYLRKNWRKGGRTKMDNERNRKTNKQRTKIFNASGNIVSSVDINKNCIKLVNGTSFSVSNCF